MRCTTLSLALLLFVSQLSATDGHALQLRWTTGETNLNSWAGRCTLVVDAGQLEQMPRGWELVWSSDDGDLRVVPADPTARCDSSVAQVQDVSIATDIFGFQEHRTYAEFCSEAAGAATSAWFVVEFPDTARATFKIVALDPTDPDSQRVIQSGVTTLNGGATTSLPPVILRSRYTHGATAFTLDLVGAGLVSPRLVRLMGPSQDWSSPLTVTESSDTSLRAVGSSLP